MSELHHLTGLSSFLQLSRKKRPKNMGTRVTRLNYFQSLCSSIKTSVMILEEFKSDCFFKKNLLAYLSIDTGISFSDEQIHDSQLSHYNY